MKTLPAPTGKSFCLPKTAATRLGLVMILAAIIAVPFFPSSSATSLEKPFQTSLTDMVRGLSSSESPAIPRVSALDVRQLLGVPAATAHTLTLIPQAPPVETVGVFQSNCTTPATTFTLGQTMCAKISGNPLGSRPTQILRRLVIVNPAGYIVGKVNVTTNPQELIFSLPSSATSAFGDQIVDNRGDWSVTAVDTRGGAGATASFSVTDPAVNVADLAILKIVAGASEVSPGSNVSFSIFVVNYGPNAAQGVSFTDAVPANTTFVSESHSDASFTCTNPASGGTGTTTCSTPSLAKGSKVKFTLTYNVNPGTPVRTLIINQADITTTTLQRSTRDNSSKAAIVIADTGATEVCTLTCPANRVVTANTTNAGQAGAFVTFSGASSDGNCGAVTNNPASGSFFTVGTHTVTSSAQTGPSCTFTVKVVNTPAPTISCPANKVATADIDGTATVAVGTPTFTASGGGTVNGVRTDGALLTDPYPTGITGIDWTVADADGRTATCRQTVTVNVVCANDTERPTITAPANITVSTGPGNTGCGVALDDELGQAEALDNCSAIVTISGMPAGNVFPIGTTTLTYIATDPSGNTNEVPAVQLVTVVDDTPPAIAAPADATYVCPSEVPAGNANQATRGVVLNEDGDPLPPGPPFDNCGNPTVTMVETNNGGAGSTSSPLIITRTFTAVDGATPANSSSAVQTITVADGIAPSISAPADANYQCASDVPAGNANQATASDNCAAPTKAFSETNNGGLGTPASPRIITRTFTATDAAGNSANAVQTITVNDTTPPVISCPANIVVYLPLNSTATSMAVSYPTVTATDNCSTPTITGGPASGSVFPVGTTTVSKTATDVAGNTSSCSFTVTVLYNFTGFFSPVGNLPTLNTVNAGRAIPVKFSLSGNKGLDIFATGSPYTVSLNCNSSDPGVDVTETTTAGGSSLSYGPDQYHYTWKTENSWAGTCRQLVIKLNDGSEHRANFKFK